MSEYSIIIDIHEGGDITATIEGERPLDLCKSDSWGEAQRAAAELWIGLGLPPQTLETTEPEGTA